MFERWKKRREARPPAAKGRAALPIGVSRTVSCTKNEGKENPAEENLRAGVTAVPRRSGEVNRVSFSGHRVRVRRTKYVGATTFAMVYFPGDTCVRVSA